MKFAAAKTLFLLNLKANNPLATFKSFQAAVNRYGRWMASEGVADPDLDFAFDPATLEAYKNYLSTSCGLLGQTVRAQFSALKCCWTHAALKNWIEEEAAPFTRVKLPKKATAVRNHTNEREVSLLFAAARRQHSERDVALDLLLVSTFVHCGVRAKECSNIEVGHINFEEGTLEVRYGKGGKSRLLHPPLDWFKLVEGFMPHRDRMDCAHAYLFAAGPRTRISDERIRARLEQLKAIADLKGYIGIKPHSLRHFSALNMEKNGAPLEGIQHALGHEHMVTTLIYLRSGDGRNTKGMTEYASFPTSPAAPPVAAPPVAATESCLTAPEPLTLPEPIPYGPATVIPEVAETLSTQPETDRTAKSVQIPNAPDASSERPPVPLEPSAQAGPDRSPRREPLPPRPPEGRPMAPAPRGPGRTRSHLQRERLAERRYSSRP